MIFSQILYLDFLDINISIPIRLIRLVYLKWISKTNYSSRFTFKNFVEYFCSEHEDFIKNYCHVFLEHFWFTFENRKRCAIQILIDRRSSTQFSWRISRWKNCAFNLLFKLTNSISLSCTGCSYNQNYFCHFLSNKNNSDYRYWR